jgi:hypothetical protein
MDCPHCYETMEEETVPLVRSSTTELEKATYSRSAHYYCPNCDSEWVWLGRRKNLRLLDGADTLVAVPSEAKKPSDALKFSPH